MKKINLLFIFVISIFLFPSVVDATNMYVTVSCNNIIVGNTGTCTIKGTVSNGSIQGIDANITVSGAASIQGIPEKGSVFHTSLKPTANQISYGSDNASGTFTIATLTVKGNSIGTGKVVINNITAVDNNYENISVSQKSAQFSVTAPPTAPPPKPTTRPTTKPSTAKPTTRPTTKPSNKTTKPVSTTTASTTVATTTSTTSTTVSTSQVVTNPNKVSALKLDYVIVDNFNVAYKDGKYFVTVNYDTESVEVTAGAKSNVTILGQGTRNLAVGKNVVELILKNEKNQTAIVQVIITRPDDSNHYDTLLSLLKVVGYDIKFDKDTKEYTLTVDSSVEELYVIAESNNSGVYISGSGLKKLTKGNNDIHVLTQYGDKASTEYVIHIKRSYATTIMGCVSGLLIVGLIGSLVYFINDRKKLMLSHNNEKTKIIADANRTVVASQEAPTLNGQSVVGTGKTTVVPQQVIDKKIPMNPVAVAQSTTLTNNNNNVISNNVKENISKPFTQVKVIKTKNQGQGAVVQTPVQTQVKTINTNNTSNNYGNEQIVVNSNK